MLFLSVITGIRFCKKSFLFEKISRAMISHNEDFHIMPLIARKACPSIPCETFPARFRLEENK